MVEYFVRESKSEANRKGVYRRDIDQAKRMGLNIDKSERIIFLDVDGVLNTEFMPPRDALHEKLLQRLSDVVNKTGSKIVLSSTWRLHEIFRTKLINALAHVGIDSSLIIDDTPRLPLRLGPWPAAEQQRSAEIATWIRKNCPKGLLSWCAIDDLNLINSEHSDLFEGHFVRTTKEAGLSLSCARLLCDLLDTSNSSNQEKEEDLSPARIITPCAE